MTEWLLAVEPAHGPSFERAVDRDALVIGRAADCDLQLADSRVSRQHSRIFHADGVLCVEDLGSRNGTRVNGEVIAAPRPLAHGDLLEIADSRLRVLRSGGESTSSASPPLGLETIFRDATLYLPPEPAAASSAGLELRRYTERLRLINDVHRALAGSLSREELFALVLDRVFAHLRPEQAAVLLIDAAGAVERAAARPEGLATDELFFSRSLVAEVTGKRLAALVLDARADSRFAAAQSILTSGVRSVLAAPLLAPDGALGLIVLSSRLQVRQFDESDLELLVSLASATALQLRNLALAEEAAEQRRFAQEMALARRIQVALLPEKLPAVAGYSLFAENVPSRGVSGDLYTAALRRDGAECVLLVADVSGKGVAASLLGASLEALAIGPIEVGHGPAEICFLVSRRLFQRTPPERYATAFVAVLDVASGRLAYTNAGHNPPLLLRAGGAIELLAAQGPPLGLLAQAAFGSAMVELAPGDLLVVYTDGVTEASDPEDQEFGLERLKAICRAQGPAPLPQLSQALHEELATFVRGVPFLDDRTLLVLRREPG